MLQLRHPEPVHPHRADRARSGTPMNASETHREQLPATQAVCDTCGTLFTPKRAWGRFCSGKCRGTFHTIRDAAPRLLAALKAIAAGDSNPIDTAKAAIKKLPGCS